MINMNNIYNKEHNRCKHSWTIQEKIKAGFTLPLAFGPFATKILEWPQLKVQSKLALPVSMSEDSEEKKKERVSNSLDPDQAQNFVGPDVGPNCLQR